MREGVPTILLSDRELIERWAPSIKKGEPVAVPCAGFIYKNKFHGRGVSPTGWHAVVIPAADLKTLLELQEAT